MRILRHFCSLVASVLVLSGAADAAAQASLPIYLDSLANGFQDWSWASHNLANTNPVHAGSYSISVSATPGQALSFYHAGFDTSPYAGLSFWIRGGSGGQVLQVYVQVNGVDQPPVLLPALPAVGWQYYNVALSSLNAADQTNVSRFYLGLTGNGTTGTFYVDDIQLAAKPAPAVVHLNVNTAQPVRATDLRWSGVNTAIYDRDFDTPETVSLLREMGTLVLRFPGGSLSDLYHWRSNYIVGSSWQGWPTWFTNFAHVATNVGAQAIITANYGTGTPEEAADWVRYSNLTNGYGFKYWEVGNENYGTWEADSNAAPHDAFTYAQRAADYIQQMKAADPTIKVGVVVSPGEDSNDNGYRGHRAVNRRTGQSHYGWTPVVLATLTALGVWPDFVVHHRYPEYTDGESDPLLLQTCGAWTGEAADLRQQISDYCGPAGTNTELLCTENNSNAGSQGKQSVSLVNALYYAGSLAQLMQTEFNSFVWWDLRNGMDTSGNLDPTLYGWRLYGDIGMVGGLTNRYPPFYAAKLMQYFARPGDTILSASSDYPLLSAYAAQQPDETLELLVLNKDSIANFSARITLAGFSPDAEAILQSYGIPQDEAARTGIGSPDIAETSCAGVSSNFSYSFPPLSLTLFTFLPPRLVVAPASQAVAAGNTGVYTVSALRLTKSFTLSVTGLPPGGTARFSPASVTGSSPSTLSVTTLDTTPPGEYPLTITGRAQGVTKIVSATLIVRPQLLAWGNDDFDQSAIPPLTNITAIAAGGYHSLALLADGSVFAWGDNWSGQCDCPGNLTNIVAIAAGGYHSLALRADGTVIAWGDNGSGQTTVPAGATNIVAIAAGGWHSLALREDGRVIAWGDNELGQIAVPVNATNIIALAAGGEHSLALEADGTVIAWGSNFDPYGAYCDQAKVPSSVGQAIAVAAGGFHSLALRTDGTVAAWGDNSQGQASAPAGLTNVLAIAAGEAHSLALVAPGSLVAWGGNAYGQSLVETNTLAVTAIAASGSHSLALMGRQPSGPRLNNPVRTGHLVSVSVPTLRGKAYFLQYKDHLTDPVWFSSGPILGNGALRTLTDPAVDPPCRFYRVRQQ